jgi:hypothetical protein
MTMEVEKGEFSEWDDLSSILGGLQNVRVGYYRRQK